jgi:hypothetical protein
VDNRPDERWKSQGSIGDFSEALIDTNLSLRLRPTPFTAAMIASEIPAAICLRWNFR